MADTDKDLIDGMLSSFEPESARRRQLGELAAALGAVSVEEARQLYRVASERADLPDLEELAFFRIPFLLFGPQFVIEVVSDLRAGTQEVPIRELVIEPLEDV